MQHYDCFHAGGSTGRHDGSALLNGVELPPHVVDELERLGLMLSSYNAHDLQEAIRACHFDRQLIDDPNGAHFHDQLHLDSHEEKADSGAAPRARHRMNLYRVQSPESGYYFPGSFCLEEEEEEGRSFGM